MGAIETRKVDDIRLTGPEAEWWHSVWMECLSHGDSAEDCVQTADEAVRTMRGAARPRKGSR